MPFSTPSSASLSLIPIRRVQVACRWVAVTMALVGGAALVGRLTGIEWLRAPVQGWRPMVPFGAISLISLSGALWWRISHRLRLARLGAALPLGIAIIAMIAAITDIPLPGEGLPLGGALLFAIAATGLLVGTMEAGREVEKGALGAAGIALITLSVTLGFAQSIGAFRGESAPDSSAAALQLIICMVLLGGCFLAQIWTRGLQQLAVPQWLPAATGLASLIAVMSLWGALVDRERAQASDASQNAAISEEQLLRREMDATASALRRAAEGAAAGSTFEQQQLDLRALQRDIPSLESASRLAADGTPIVLEPLTADVEPVIALWRAYMAGVRTQPDTLTYLPLDSTSSRFVIFAPICAARCVGTIAGVVRSSTAFSLALNDTLLAFRYALAGPSGPLEGASLISTPPSAADRLIQKGAVRWWLTVWPRPRGPISETNLPGAVLFMGLIVTLLLPLTMHLGRSAWEGARERERARLSLALDRATDGIWELDLPSGQAVRSPALWRHLKYDPDAVAPDAEGWNALIHPEDRSRTDEAFRRHLVGEHDSYEAEYRVRAADGKWHTVMDRGRVVDRTPLGAPRRLLGVSADVTEARASTRAREASERRFRALFNSGFQFQVLLACDCKVLEVNQVALDHAGLAPNEVVNRDCWDTLWWSDSPAAQQILRDSCAAANSGKTETWEQEVRLPGRLPCVLELSIKPIQDDDGKSTQLLLEGRDITERRRAEAGSKEVDTLTTMGRVAARVAHEINNPLAGIQNAFLLIKDAVPPSHPHFAYVGAIEREIGRISKVTRQLYETYRPEQDTTGMASVQLVVTDAVAFLEQVNRSGDVRIVTDLVRASAAVPVPASILRQIVYNLVQNAIDVSPAGGLVSVTAVAGATTLELSVCDQGPGVPEALREQIFDPFFSTKEKEMKTSGMGMGLALVKRTVTAASGTIRIQTAPGGGAEFVVLLPIDLRDETGRES